MSNSFRFTDKSVKDLKPTNKRAYYHDTVEKDLMLQITPNGAKTFYLYKRIDGQPVRYKLGKPSDMKITQVREAAIKVRGMIASGVNPQKTRKDLRDESTVGQMFQKVMSEKKMMLASSTYKEYQRIWNTTLKTYFANKKLSQITPDVLKRFHRRLGDSPYCANRCIALIKAMFNHCIKEGTYKGLNPALGVRMNKEEPRVRYLERAEIVRFFEVLNNIEFSCSKYAILIMLFTGARKSNVLHMKWSEIDMDAKIWKMPKTKTSKNATIALADSSIELLEELKELNPSNPFVFPSTTSKSGHLEDIKRVWGTIRKRANISDVRLHDLRHTLATYMVAGNVNPFIVQRALTHKSIKSTQIYVNLGVETLRDAINDTVNTIKSIGKMK